MVDGLPLANAELLSALRSLEADLEDRFNRLANRLGDQVTAFEEANAAELARLRDHLFDLADAQATAGAEREVVDRMAAQVERLTQSTVASDTAEAVELLIAEHLEVLRDELEERVGAIVPLLQEELEAVRTEAAAAVSTSEDALAERIEALDAAVGARLDAALLDQVDALDAAVGERLGQALAEHAGSTDARLDDLAAAATAAEASTGQQLAALLAIVTELQEAQAATAERAPSADADEGLAAVTEELKALRRRITLRLEGEGPAGLTAEQVEDVAAQVAARLAAPARPVRAAGPGTRAPRVAKKA